MASTSGRYLAEGSTRLKDVELVFPFCVGTVAIALGKKAQSDYHSHQWTVYVRGPNNEDISHIITKVTFGLHESFAKPVRIVEQPPFELTETGWGEFDIAVTLHLAPQAESPPVELLHRLKLYEEHDTQPNPKRPVVKEEYEELVFSEPPEAFVNLVNSHMGVPAPFTEITPYFPIWNEQHEVNKINAARQKIAQLVAELRHQHEGGGSFA